MLKNYLVITIRNMVRNKLFTIINILGISVSLGCCILLFLFAQRELSYDRHHGGNVYRLTSNVSQKDGQVFKLGSSSLPVAPAIQEELPEVKLAVRAAGSAILGGKNLISHEGESWYIDEGYIVDSAFFNVLNFDIDQGNQVSPLPHTSAVVLESDWAKKIFGMDDPIGKTVKLSLDFGEGEFEVTAVYDKDSHLCHINPSYFVSMANPMWTGFFNNDNSNWIGNNLVFSYASLNPGSDVELVDKKLNDLIQSHGGEESKQLGLNKTMRFQSVEDIHTDVSGYMINIPGVVNPIFINVLVMIGILILVLACVNYVNLSTAQAGNRALEVGVRKVMGVTPRGLLFQFLGESFILVFISLLFSLLFAWLALPLFNKLIDKPLNITEEFYPILGLYMAGFLLVTGLFAGFYPAFYLASFKPVQVLKGRSRDRLGAALLRKGLVVLQFVISISLISSIVIISRQVNFIKDKELGFDKNAKLVIPLNSQEAQDKYDVLKNSFSSMAMVRKISGTNAIPGSFIIQDMLVYKKGQTMADAIHIYRNQSDLGYCDVLGMKLISGRTFTDNVFDTTQTKIVVSEEAVKQLGFKAEEAPGEIIYFDWEGKQYSFEIIGVVNDINQFSLHKAIDPIMYLRSDNFKYRNLVLDAEMDQFQVLITQLQKLWKEIVPNTPFNYVTLDDHLMVQYAEDFKTFDLIKYFGIISILISCMGLYAMSMYLAERRFREIGIRKAFGAETRNIIFMVSGELSKLILIAFVLSVPVSVLAMNKWLDTFVFKISQGVDIYLLAGIISLGIGWLTISYQSFRAARTNPVKVLREE
ncbi:MAG TPA: ABC transporter permease [Cyclobacteriaceae bacterium]|nr:ABC transporter permease [Cyclobacteriaceae bacterium]